MMMESPAEDRDVYSDMINSAAVDSHWIHNKVIAGDSTFFRKLITLHELQMKMNRAQRPNVGLMAAILKGLEKSTQPFKHMHCSCLNNMSSCCKRCDYRCQLLKKFGGSRRDWSVGVDIDDLLGKEEIKLLCQDQADYVQNIYNRMRYAEYFG